MSFKIAVITPTYNRPELLARLHNSLRSQTGSVDWIHIVIDDCSSLISPISTIIDPQTVYIRLNRNSGPLIARNIGLKRAHALGYAWVCFVDDDDYLVPHAFETIEQTVRSHPCARFLMFGSGPEISPMTAKWPKEITRVSWITDIAVGVRYGVDNFVVLSVAIVGDARFSEFGRSQREWTFFARVARGWDEVLVCPDSLRVHHYLEGGLTHTTNRDSASLAGVWNILSRAIVYYSLKPTSLKLGLRLAKQLSLLPLRLALVGWQTCKRFDVKG